MKRRQGRNATRGGEVRCGEKVSVLMGREQVWVQVAGYGWKRWEFSRLATREDWIGRPGPAGDAGAAFFWRGCPVLSGPWGGRLGSVSSDETGPHARPPPGPPTTLRLCVCVELRQARHCVEASVTRPESTRTAQAWPRTAASNAGRALCGPKEGCSGPGWLSSVDFALATAGLATLPSRAQGSKGLTSDTHQRQPFPFKVETACRRGVEGQNLAKKTT